MNPLYIYTVFAGIMWGIWPILMSKSGLEGFASAAIFSFIVLITVIPFGVITGQFSRVEIAPMLWYAVIAGLFGGFGMLAFNTMLSKAEPSRIGIMVIFMILTQISVPAIYTMIKSGDYSPRKIIGLSVAFLAAYLLG